MVTILVLFFNDYDIHVNTLFKVVKDAFTVKVKNVCIQVQNAVDVKRIVTRSISLLSVNVSLDPQTGVIKQLTTVEPRQCDHR